MDIWILVALAGLAVGLALMATGSRAQERNRATARIATIERKLDAVMAHLGVAAPAPEEPEVVRLLELGKRIEAIKVYRERTGLGLAEAKGAVDEIARERGLSAR